MDFASAPFQSLLVQNAGDEQLLNFLNQLDEQFINSVDEKVRFGNLQILLPILKAHLVRLDNHEKEEACLEKFVKPWLISSFSQDSMVATESVALLENTVSFLVARSLLLHNNQADNNFGRTVLLMILSQLISAMELEPDFVDLKPLEYIESSIAELSCQTQWDQVQTHITVQDSANQVMLDLECCFDILYRFVRDLNENEELLSLEQVSESATTEIRQWMELIYTVATAMIPCTDSAVRSKLSHELLPNLLRWQQNPMQKIELDKQIFWCEMLWKRTLQMFALPATNLLRIEIYGLIARFFDFYFGLAGTSTTPVVHKDLRFDANFFKILQSGLQSNDSLARKYSSYLLKRIIDFTEKYPDTIAGKSDNEWTPYFKWSTSISKEFSEYWDDWFLLYDIMHENVIHLVDPVLPRFETLLHSNELDASWWVLLLYRGFQNDTPSVKKGLLEFIFSRENPSILNKLGSEQGFMFAALLKILDNTNLFSVPTQGTLVSPFGEHYREFLARLIKSFENDTDRINFLRQLIHHLSHVVGSYAPILYTMEALAESDYVDAWGPEELKSLRVLVDRHRNFNIPATKQFLRRLGIAAVVKLSNTNTLSFSDIAKTISSLVNEYPVKTNSKEFAMIRYWLENRISKDKSIHSVLSGLRDRIKTYVHDLKSEDIPEAVLRTQANVLARSSVFVVANEQGDLDNEYMTELLSVFADKLKDSSCDATTFSRLLTLLEALWENFSVSFEGKCDFIKSIGLTEQDMWTVLDRIDKMYLNKEEENVVDEGLVELYLSLTRRILLSGFEGVYESVQSHYEKCLELLKYRAPSVDSNKEMSKPYHIRLLSIVYESARRFSYFNLDCNDAIVSLVYGLPMKRTQDALRERTWGDCLSVFIRSKWNCIDNIVRYASLIKKNGIKDKEFFNPVELYEEAVEQLENASENCGEAIIKSFEPLLAFPWDKTPEMIERCVDHAISLMNENAFQSKTFPLLIKAFIDVIFQKELLCVPELNEEDGPMKKAFKMVLQTGELKPFIIAQVSKHLHSYWSTFTEDATKSMIQYAPEIAQLLVFGPLRDRDDQKLEAAITIKLASAQDILDAEGTAAIMFNQNDYLVRVDMNDLLLRLDINNKDHKEFANLLLANFFKTLSDDSLFEYMYTSTAGHRLKLRICCSTLLIIDFSEEEKVNDYIETIFEVMRKETVTSVRCYLEWAMVRLLNLFPDRLSLFFSKIADPTHKPNFVISLLTLTFTLGSALPDECIAAYFDEIFVRLMPWLTTNHFTVRLFSYCAWRRNWKSCIDRGCGKELEGNKYLQSINHFMNNHVDCVKFLDKISNIFYMSKFDPMQDFNVEFIFRQMMTEFQVIDNERIGSKAFLRVNAQPVERCPFDNPSRKEVYTSADPSELIALEEEIEAAATDSNGNSNAEEVIQKKILPWEMMLETDMDLTKNLVQKNRRRNDLIVVASLIDRLPNLAGLCRTCEIFNASTLVVPTLKIKEDIGFTTISVASEKWMPMIEVVESDVAKFLQEKKDEGYTLCGLEQTTTSATLGEYEFPEKCVLLLGKERQGVPADLLQLLDVTIEIPQYGITRSLNVHVSGAICIYEYTKQMHWRQQQAAITQ